MSAAIAVLKWQTCTGLFRFILGDEADIIDVDPFSECSTELFERLCRDYSIVCFQIDLSHFRTLPIAPQSLSRRLRKQGLHVVNGRILDIRKSALHQHLETIGLNSPRALEQGDPEERLFVKSNLNFAGVMESGLAPGLQKQLGFDRLLPDIGPYDYHILRRKDLAEQVWHDPTLVVEKFISNVEDSFYRVYFCGKQIVVVKGYTAARIKKIADDPRDTNYVSELDYYLDGSDGLPLSPQLKAQVGGFIHKTPVEFGCLDIMHDGKETYTVVDLNLTPSADGGDPSPRLSAFLKLGVTLPAQRKVSRQIDSALF